MLEINPMIRRTNVHQSVATATVIQKGRRGWRLCHRRGETVAECLHTKAVKSDLITRLQAVGLLRGSCMSVDRSSHLAVASERVKFSKNPMTNVTYVHMLVLC